jgi:thiamine kinase-like enzyme
MNDFAKQKVSNLSCWNGPVDPVPLTGGITNTNFVVTDAGAKYVVRIGEDIPVHGIMRFNEVAASRAAHAAGLSPNVVHVETGVLVLDFIQSKTLVAEDVRKPEYLAQIIPIIKNIHHKVPDYLQGPSLVFWVFQVLRDYRRTLHKDNSRMIPELGRLQSVADDLETSVGPVDLVFGHNDLLAANFLDDGNRLWIIDWDYAGFNSPLFDLANLASNNDFNKDQEYHLLEEYFGKAVDAALWKSYGAMKCASLLREAMWSMISEIHSNLDFDFVHYTSENLDRFENVYEGYKMTV